MFVDRATLRVRAGSGGDGLVSFRREKYIPRGGPDGGDGGDGGSVILRAVENLNSLDRLNNVPVHQAEDGIKGGNRKRHGRRGQSLVVELPCGTIVRDLDGELVVDLTEAGQEFVIARGGKGGKGNVHFATATRQVPRIATLGEPGEEGRYKLELKLIAQVGLVGLPNAGKSTFLRATTEATPAVGAYPFTTLTPYLGVARLDEKRELVIADIPGLIEGASDGVGLGHEFLRHVERTRVLLHMVEATGGEEFGTPTPVEAWSMIHAELVKYDEAFKDKGVILALNKCDAITKEQSRELKEALEEASGCPVFRISAVTGKGTRKLLFALARLLDEANAADKQSE